MMKLYAFHAGGEKSTMAIFDPFHPEVSKLVDIPYFFYLIQHPLGNVLFDTGCHPDLITDPGKRLGDVGDDFGFALDIKEGDDVVSRLAQVGLQPSDISHVVQSHLHFDHAGGIEFFPDATFYASRRELQAAFWPPPHQEGIYVQADFDHPVQWQALTGWHDLFGDGRLVIFPTPGHSPGHQSLLVKLDNQNVILVADAAYLPRSLELGVLPAVVASPDAMVESWDLLKHLQAEHDAEMIFCHDLDWRGKTLVGPEQCYE